MKVTDLILAKCIDDDNSDLEKDRFYIVVELEIGQSRSAVKINDVWYNSIRFEYYDDCMNEIDIYHSKYSPYLKNLKKAPKIQRNEIDEEWLKDKYFLDFKGLNKVLKQALIKQNEIINYINKSE